jgi:hypothetical protein
MSRIVAVLFFFALCLPAVASDPVASSRSSATPAPPTLAPSVSPSPSMTPKPVTPQPSVVNDPIYGEYPVRYKGIIMDWLYTHLYDPPSAKVEWQEEPKRANLPDAKGRKIYGWLVQFSVNARNRFGGYTGKQMHGILIRNGAVVQTTGFVYEKR